MIKKTTQILVGLCSLLIVAGLSSWITLWCNNKGTITIKNNTNQPINEIYVIYQTNGSEIKSFIGTISANSKYQYRINYGNINEGSMRIVYQDKIIDINGYIASYDKQHYKVDIE